MKRNVVAIAALTATAIVFALSAVVITVRHNISVRDQYSSLRSECGSVSDHIDRYLSQGDKEQLRLAREGLQSSISAAFAFEDDEIGELRLSLLGAYGELTDSFDEAEEHLAELGRTLSDFSGGGGVGEAIDGVNDFVNAVSGQK